MSRSEGSPNIASAFARIIARTVHLAEKDGPKLLWRTGLSTDILTPGNSDQISPEQQLQLIDNAMSLANSPELGLRLGAETHLTAFGSMAYLIFSSPDLISSLKILEEFLPHRVPFVGFEARCDDRELSCRFLINTDCTADQRRLMQECFAVLIQTIVETVSDGEILPGRLELSHDKPDYNQTYSDYLHYPVKFACDLNRLVLPAKYARTRNVAVEVDNYVVAQRIADQILEQTTVTPQSTVEQVRRLLISRLPYACSATDISRDLFIATKTLSRRLQREGRSFRGVKEAVLAELAQHYLAEGDVSIEAISVLLGYSEPAAFRRAFRRWNGVTPQMFRADLQSVNTK